MADRTRKRDKEESLDLFHMAPLEDDEEAKEGKVLKILTPKIINYTSIATNKSCKQFIQT